MISVLLLIYRCCSDGDEGTKQRQPVRIRTSSSSMRVKKRNKDTVKNQRSSTPSEKDPHMSELIAHMFLYEKVKAKEIAEELAAKAARKAAGKKHRRDVTNCK